MTALNTTVLDLLGKQVSFVRSIEINSFVHTSDYLGIVTSIVINLTGEPEISINQDGEYHCFSDLIEFEVLS